jgi:hypothetical protein
VPKEDDAASRCPLCGTAAVGAAAAAARAPSHASDRGCSATTIMVLRLIRLAAIESALAAADLELSQYAAATAEAAITQQQQQQQQQH